MLFNSHYVYVCKIGKSRNFPCIKTIGDGNVLRIFLSYIISPTCTTSQFSIKWFTS